MIDFDCNMIYLITKLFKRPHPQKKLNMRSSDSAGGTVVGSMEDRLFFHNVDNLKPTKSPIKGQQTRFHMDKSFFFAFTN